MIEEIQEDGSYQGIRFCPSCNNILMPFRANDNILQFNCKNCGKREVDFTDKMNQECLLYSKHMSATTEETQTIDKDFALDPTMPRVKIQCQQCHFPEAVYCLQPQQGQRKIKVLLVCGRVQKNRVICGHNWELDENVLVRI